MHKSCEVHKRLGSVTVTCHEPLSHLNRNPLLVMWSGLIYPWWKLRQEKDMKIKVRGLPAKWLVTSSKLGYPKIGAAKDIQVFVPVPKSSGSFTYLGVQLRGPDTKELVQEVGAMVRSVQWSKTS